MDNIDFREKKMAMAHMYYLNYLFSIELSMFNRVDNFNFPNGYQQNLRLLLYMVIDELYARDTNVPHIFYAK